MFGPRAGRLVGVVAAIVVLAACGSGSSDAAEEDRPQGSQTESTTSGGEFVFAGQNGRPDVEFSAEEASAGLASVEETIRGAVDGHEDSKCWMIVLEDGRSPTHVRCGPKKLPGGELSWGSLPVAGERGEDGVFRFSYFAQAGTARFPTGNVTLVRPDGEEAPDAAYSDSTYE